MRYLLLMLASLIALLLAAVGCGSGDEGAATVQVQKLVTVTVTDAISLPGQVQPATVDTVTLWLGPDVARRDVGPGSLLVHLEPDRLTWLDHERRTWTSQTAHEVRRQLSALAADTTGPADGDPRLERLRSMLQVAVAVTESDDRRRFDGYQCRRWIVEQRQGEQTTTSELWLTRDLTVDWDLLQRISQPTLAALPGGRQALAELSRLEGFPVRSYAILQVMGREARSETRLIAAETVIVPANHFLPPAGYRPSGPTTPAPGPTK